MSAKDVAKVVLGGIGGGLSGAANRPIDLEDEKNEKDNNKNTVAKAVLGGIGGGLSGGAMSDETLKSIYGDSIDDRIIENFAKISAIEFTYNDEAQEKYDDNLGVDDKEHIGVIAQELAANDATKGTVTQNENGDLEVDTRHLAFADTAAIAELSRRILALEEAVKELKGEE